MDSAVGEVPAKGLRVWTQIGLKLHGLNKTDVPAETGGNIIFQDKEDKVLAVQWDTGTVTVHSIYEFGKELICIAMSKTLDDYLAEKRET